MNVDDIKRVYKKMVSDDTMDPDTASNMLLGLLLSAYGQGKSDGLEGKATGESIRLFVEGTRNV